MDFQLLATKLNIPPARPDLILRPRLLERLSDAENLRLILISAPPGYGKTSLVAGWLHRRASVSSAPPTGFSWLTLDEADNDPLLFFAYLAATAQRLAPELAIRLPALLATPQLPPVEILVSSLLSDLEGLPGPAFFVLDDYHVIHNPAIHQTLALLLDRSPGSLHLVINSREDPPLPLPRLRVRREMIEIRAADLRFSLDEAIAFLSQTMRLHLHDEAVAELLERTEGWAAGLQMAALALQAGEGQAGEPSAEAFLRSFRGDDRYVMDYLMDEVFRHQPADLQSFLLQTAILERISAPLACAVIDPPEERTGVWRSCQVLLETMEKANLFLIALDHHREWYRYHHLFADLLRYRLKRDHPERLQEYYRRAARWYFQAGIPDEAIRYALSAEDRDLTSAIAEQYGMQMIGTGRITAFLSWVQPIPEQIIFTRPLLCAACGWAYVLAGQPDLAERYAQAGEEALAHLGPGQPDSRMDQWQANPLAARGHLSAIRSYIARGRGETRAAIDYGRHALAILPTEEQSARCAAALNLGFVFLDKLEYQSAHEALLQAIDAAGSSKENIYAAVTALSLLGDICTRRGKLREAEGYFLRAVQYGQEGNQSAVFSPAQGIIHGWLMWLHFQRNEIQQARQHLELVMQAAEQLGSRETTIRAYIYQAMLDQVQGNMASTATWLSRAEEIAPGNRMSELLLTEWLVVKVHHLLNNGDLPDAALLLASQGVKSSDLELVGNAGSIDPLLANRLARYLALAHVLRAQGDIHNATHLLERTIELAEALPDMTTRLEAMALLSTFPQKGSGAIKQALNLAAPEGYVVVFLRAGSGLVLPLGQAIAEGIQPTYAHHLRNYLIEQQRRVASPDHVSPGFPVQGAYQEAPNGLPDMIEPLTERERQVMRLLAAGLSSTEVAENLTISVSTARSYIKNIYAKLEAHNRAEAVEKAARLGFL